jgi:hypothetical protein
VRSILDVLLEDFNKKFCLGISLEERLSPDLFEEEASRLKNKEGDRVYQMVAPQKRFNTNQ